MKKRLFLLLLLFSSAAFAKPAVIVSILPQKTFVQKIAKDMVDLTLMVEPGNSPHSYEPKSSQMIAISKADVYFSIGVEFEGVWLPKFKSQNEKLHFVDISQNIAKLETEEETHNHAREHEHNHEGADPHIWTSPKNVEIMAKTIYKTLAELDPKNKTAYKTNLDLFLKEIKYTDEKIKEILKDLSPKSKFMVFHPSWGYFAKEYNLTQIAVEAGGKEPKPKEMIHIINEAKEERVRVIFTQPEFSDKSAKIIAKEVGIEVKKVSPLNPEWSQNLIELAKSIAQK